ncbi:hypothetical protein [Dyella silvatica]|uniref:hypothetical protein n=1 Tax=Dyella silvatica TaxID=2992128 RepID=UPI0022556E8C|nr:hypothetical protein [Dyella silvatica]
MSPITSPAMMFSAPVHTGRMALRIGSMLTTATTTTTTTITTVSGWVSLRE